MKRIYNLLLVVVLVQFAFSCTAQNAIKSVHNGAFHLINKCPFDVKFDLVDQNAEKSTETIEEGDDNLYNIGQMGILVIRYKNAPEDGSAGNAYQVFEKKRYGLEYSEEEDKVILVKYEL